MIRPVDLFRNAQHLLQICLVLIAIACTACHSSRVLFAADNDRPNVLILMADNWAWPHAGVLGDPVVKTPTFDALAKNGVLFNHTFCLVPSCSPARAAFLTGQAIHRLKDAASLHSLFPSEYPVFTNQLEDAGYRVGHSGKGWGPGKWKESGRQRDPAGQVYPNFQQFLSSTSKEKPFCFWFSSRNPHIPWDGGRERKTNMDATKVNVPKYLPDCPEVRDNILDYMCEVEAFDQECADHLKLLKEHGLDSNTIILMLGDNGWQMPHGLAHCYDSGTRVPLVIAAPAHILQPNRVCDQFISFDDLAPTILELTQTPITQEIKQNFTGKSMVPLLKGDEGWVHRDAVYLERERHANVRQNDAGYPVRAIRTRDHMLIHNIEPDRWPAGIQSCGLRSVLMGMSI